MSKSEAEAPTRKSKSTKAAEAFEDLPLDEKITTYELITELLRVDLEKEKAALSQKRSDVEEMLEQIKK